MNGDRWCQIHGWSPCFCTSFPPQPMWPITTTFALGSPPPEGVGQTIARLERERIAGLLAQWESMPLDTKDMNNPRALRDYIIYWLKQGATT